MGVKATTVQERTSRVGQRRRVVIPQDILETLQLEEGDFVVFTKQPGGVLIKPKRAVDPDDVLTPEEGALVDKARREMRQGNYIPLSKLEHDLDHKRSPRRRKTA
jgi:AbrB family looped-hinge helix DNA binding protein